MTPSHVAAEFVVLNSRHSTLVLEAPAGEAPIWRYWGPRLPDGTTPGTALRDTRPMPPFMLDFDQPLTVFPTFGVGWFGQSALLAHRAGQQFAQALNGCEIEWHEAERALTLHLVDTVAALRVDIDLTLDEASDVLVVCSAITNLGDTPLDVQWFAAGTLPLPGRVQAVRSYAGQHVNEFMLQTDTLSRSLWQRENRRGRTSHDCFPGAVVTTPGAGDDDGLVFGAHLAWSGNHRQAIEWLPDAQYQWQMGEWLAPGEGLLAPGATLRSPELIASLSTAGFNGLAVNFHGELRSRLRWPGGTMKPRPVHLNTWEAFYMDLQPAQVMALADAAAAIGIERFVVDDGWFHGRNDDHAGLGDWWPDRRKLADGLLPLASHIHALGMEFGLWFEPEMVNPDSDLYRAHPDWALQIAGRPLLTGRNQLVLDLARPETSDYLFGKIDQLLRELPIAYIKWDLNRDLTTAGGAEGRPGYRAQVHASYALMARLRAAHPQLEIESCSGGGGRIDFAVLRHTHRVWTSDCIDALSRIDIQRSFLQFFPPEIMGAHVGAVPAHTTGRTQSMAFRAAVALPGHFGVELDVRHLEPQARDELKAWIGLYKRWRDRLHHGRVWRGELDDGIVWQVHGDRDADELLLFAYRVRPTSHRYMPALPMARIIALPNFSQRCVST